MKHLSLIASFVCLAVAPLLAAAESEQKSPLDFKGKVEKVLSFEEGNDVYTAYLVKWKDHLIAVHAEGLRATTKPLAEADTIAFHLKRAAVMDRVTGKGLLVFGLGPSPEEETRRLRQEMNRLREKRESRARGTDLSTDDAQRMQAYREEFSRRRELRQERAEETEGPEHPKSGPVNVRHLEVRINGNGMISIAGKDYTLAEFSVYLQAVKDSRTGIDGVIVSTSEDSALPQVTAVLDACRKAGFNKITLSSSAGSAD